MYEKTGTKSIALAFNRGTGLNDLFLTGKYTLIVTRLCCAGCRFKLIFSLSQPGRHDVSRSAMHVD
jgi:hypothetical protein